MLAIVEKFIGDFESAASEADVLNLLEKVSGEFDFQSAFIVECAGDRIAPYVLDTSFSRRAAWSRFFASAEFDDADIPEVLGQAGLVILGRNRFHPDHFRLQEFCGENDLLDCVLVPVHHDGSPIGAIGYSGIGQFDAKKQTALLLISYNIFAAMRRISNKSLNEETIVLTKREQQVVSLAADGLTSAEIARALQISTRTVNQHVDNTIRKTRARSRTNAVAEAIRKRLI